MATLAAETWTGTTGAAWPAQWSTTGALGTQTIQSAAGQMVTGTGTYATARRLLSSLSASDVDVTITFTWPTGGIEQYLYVYLRHSGSWGVSAWEPAAGYALRFAASGSTVNWEIDKGTGAGAHPSVSASGSFATPTVATNIRFQAIGGTVRFKVWAASGSEPATWAGTATDASPAAAGTIGLGYINGSDGVSRAITFDDLTVTDGAATTSVSASLTGPGTLTVDTAPTSSVSTALAGSGTLSVQTVTPAVAQVWNFDDGTQQGFNPGPNWTVANSAVRSYSSPNSLLCTRANATAGSGYTQSPFTAVLPDTRYTVSAWVFASATTTYSFSVAGNVSASRLVNSNFTPTAGAWQLVSCTIITGSTDTLVSVYVTDDPNGAPTAASTLNIDDLTIMPVPPGRVPSSRARYRASLW